MLQAIAGNHQENNVKSSSTLSGPTIVLRLEGGLVLTLACLAYGRFAPEAGWGWGMFALLFLIPDLSMLGYLLGRWAGAAMYNLGHSYLLPGALAAWGLQSGQQLLPVIALIWVAHIGFDRLAGYGLKYGSGFGDTHLGRKGRAISAVAA